VIANMKAMRNEAQLTRTVMPDIGKCMAISSNGTSWESANKI
jgi:hypothetical protein